MIKEWPFIASVFQADQRWGRRSFASGPKTIGQIGCVITSLVAAARALVPAMKDLTPDVAADRFAAVGAFNGQALVVEKAAPVIGLVAGARIDSSPCDASLKTALRTTLETPGMMALVRVDLTGDSIGDHTLLAWGIVDDERARCWDPAAGATAIDMHTLTAIVSWGKKDMKTYRVTGVRPLHAIGAE